MMIYIFVIVVCAIVGAVIWNFGTNKDDANSNIVYAPVTTKIINNDNFKGFKDTSLDGYTIYDIQKSLGTLYTKATIGRFITYNNLQKASSNDYIAITRRILKNEIKFEDVANSDLSNLNNWETELDAFCEKHNASTNMVDVILDASIFAEILRSLNNRKKEFFVSFENNYNVLLINNEYRFSISISSSIFQKIKKRMDINFEKTMGKQVHSLSKGIHFGVLQDKQNDYCIMKSILPYMEAKDIYENILIEDKQEYYNDIELVNNYYKLLPNKPSKQLVSHYLLEIFEPYLYTTESDVCDQTIAPLKSGSSLNKILAKYANYDKRNYRHDEYVSAVLNKEHEEYDETVDYGFLKGHIVTKTSDDKWSLNSKHPLLVRDEPIVIPPTIHTKIIPLNNIVDIMYESIFKNKASPQESLLIRMAKIELFSNRITEETRKTVLEQYPESPFLKERVDVMFSFTPVHKYSLETNIIQKIRTNNTTNTNTIDVPQLVMNIENSPLEYIYVNILRNHSSQAISKLILSELKINDIDYLLLNKRLQMLSILENT